MIVETLGVVVNTFTGDGKNSGQDCNSQFKCNYLKNEKLFLNFLFHFWNLCHILNFLKEKMIVIANLFPKLETVNNLFRTLSKNRRFRACFDSQHVKAFQILAKTPWQVFYLDFLSFSGNLISKLSSLVLDEILGVFVNTLTADDKYPVQDYVNLQIRIQMHLCGKRKTFCRFFVAIVESTSTFKHFKRKEDRHR